MKLRRSAIALMAGLIAVVAVACGSSDSGSDELAAAGPAAAPAAQPAVAAAGGDEASVWAGALFVPVPDALAQLLGIPAGERVAWVSAGGPAAGLLILGDTVTAVDGQPLDESGGIEAALEGRVAGDAVTLSVLRGDESLDVQIVLAAKAAHQDGGGLAELQDLVDRAVSGEFTFLDGEGGEHTAAFASGTLSGLDGARVTLARSGGGPMTVTLSPNVFLWVEGGPASADGLADAVGGPAKLFTLDGEAVAMLAGGIIPPALQALEGLFGEGGDGLLEALGALEALEGLFGGADPPVTPEAGL